MSVLSGKKADYGQDAPDLLRDHFLRSGSFALLGIPFTLISTRRSHYIQRVMFRLGMIALLASAAAFVRGLVMIWSCRIGKPQSVDYLLDRLGLRGNETVLDVGCGRGLLLNRAAKRLLHGHAIGVDIWSNEDQGANSRQATLDNARIEGVLDRIEVLDGDMRALPLANASVDVVVASKAIHNIPDRQGRHRALTEILRVLKPGGQVAIMDIYCIEEFAQILQELGLLNVEVVVLPYFSYPQLRMVAGQKGAATLSEKTVGSIDSVHHTL